MNVKTRNRVWLISTLFLIVVSLAILAFYKPDYGPYVAASSSSAEEIEAAMSKSKYIRFVKDLGITPEGKALFSYRWENCGAFDISSCTEEVRGLYRLFELENVGSE